MSEIFVLLIIFLTVYFIFEAYCFSYFNSDQFETLNSSINAHVSNCNALNLHIDELKSSYANIKSSNYGQGELYDSSKYNFKREGWTNFIQSSRVHNCSASVLGNVKSQPLKYLCKYFDIKTTEDTLSNIEEVLNAFSAAEQGKMLLANERNSIVDGVKNLVPTLIFSFGKKTLIKKLGFEFIDLDDIYFPVYTFKYISSGGNSSASYDIKLNVQNLENLVSYLGDLVKFRKSAQGQRALMTTRLREEIKFRDDFSCQMCGISAKDTSNLLLEIDHIMPISRGGITSIENLQTLCWKCNRSKGAKFQNS